MCLFQDDSKNVLSNCWLIPDIIISQKITLNVDIIRMCFVIDHYSESVKSVAAGVFETYCQHQLRFGGSSWINSCLVISFKKENY